MRWFLRLFGKSREPGKYVPEQSSPATNTNRAVAKDHPIQEPAKASIIWRSESFPLQVVGESNYQRELISICGPYTQIGHDVEHFATIMLEPSNPYDSNAVCVKIKAQTVGYLPKDQAFRVATQMKEVAVAESRCMARIRGGWRTNQRDEGLFGVRLAVPTRGLIDFGLPSLKPKTSVIDWPKKPKKAKVIRPEPAANGFLKGKRIYLFGCPQDGLIAQEFADHGAKLMSKVGKTTSMLVIARERPFTVGTLASAEYKAAEELLLSSSGLRILTVDELRKTLPS